MMWGTISCAPKAVVAKKRSMTIKTREGSPEYHPNSNATKAYMRQMTNARNNARAWVMITAVPRRRTPPANRMIWKAFQRNGAWRGNAEGGRV